MSEYALLIDYKYCTNCHACEISCRNEHNYPLNEYGIKVHENGPEKMQGEWVWDYVPTTTALCDLCKDRVAEGKKPACVLHCLAACMELVPKEDLGKAMAEHSPGVVAYCPQ